MIDSADASRFNVAAVFQLVKSFEVVRIAATPLAEDAAPDVSAPPQTVLPEARSAPSVSPSNSLSLLAPPPSAWSGAGGVPLNLEAARELARAFAASGLGDAKPAAETASFLKANLSEAIRDKPPTTTSVAADSSGPLAASPARVPGFDASALPKLEIGARDLATLRGAVGSPQQAAGRDGLATVASFADSSVDATSARLSDVTAAEAGLLSSALQSAPPGTVLAGEAPTWASAQLEAKLALSATLDADKPAPSRSSGAMRAPEEVASMSDPKATSTPAAAPDKRVLDVGLADLDSVATATAAPALQEGRAIAEASAPSGEALALVFFAVEPQDPAAGTILPSAILNTMIPGWPQPTSREASASKSSALAELGAVEVGLSEAELAAYLANFGLDEQMLRRLRAAQDDPDKFPKTLAFLATLLNAAATVLGCVKQELSSFFEELAALLDAQEGDGEPQAKGGRRKLYLK